MNTGVFTFYFINVSNFVLTNYDVLLLNCAGVAGGTSRHHASRLRSVLRLCLSSRRLTNQFTCD